MEAIPQKDYYRVNEVCQYTDTQPYVLRFWESEFPQLKPTKRRGGQAVYSREDLELVLRIKRLLNEHECTISDARRLLEEEGSLPVEPRATSSAAKAAEAPAKRRRPRGSPAKPGATPNGPGETVPRERYEGALEEIAHLRLELNDLEANRRKTEAQLKQVRDENEALQRRVERAAAILDTLVERLS